MYDIVFNLQEWLGRSSSLQPSLVADSAEQSLLPFHPSQQRQDGPSESHTSAATQSQQPEELKLITTSRRFVPQSSVVLRRFFLKQMR